MRTDKLIACKGFPCTDMDHACYTVPGVEIAPEKVSIVMISEAAPAKAADYYYAGGESLFETTTLHSFRDAGANVASFLGILVPYD